MQTPPLPSRDLFSKSLSLSKVNRKVKDIVRQSLHVDEHRIKVGGAPLKLKDAVKNLEVPAIIIGKPPASPKSDLELLTPASSMFGRFAQRAGTIKLTKRPDSAHNTPSMYGNRMANTMKHDHTGLSTNMAQLFTQFESTEKTKKDSR